MNHADVCEKLREKLENWYVGLPSASARDAYEAVVSMDNMLDHIASIPEQMSVNLVDIIHGWKLNSYPSKEAILDGADVSAARLAVFSSIEEHLPDMRSKRVDMSIKIVMSHMRLNIPNNAVQAKGYLAVCSDIAKYKGDLPSFVTNIARKEAELIASCADGNQKDLDWTKGAILALDRFEAGFTNPNKLKNRQHDNNRGLAM